MIWPLHWSYFGFAGLHHHPEKLPWCPRNSNNITGIDQIGSLCAALQQSSSTEQTKHAHVLEESDRSQTDDARRVFTEGKVPELRFR
jgi:hypothetical protein